MPRRPLKIFVMFAIALFALGLGGSASRALAADGESFTPAETNNIQSVVHDYRNTYRVLVKDPVDVSHTFNIPAANAEGD